MEGPVQNVGWSLTRRDVLLVTLSLLVSRVPLAVAAREDVMEQIEQNLSKPNPKAPPPLSHFVFLIGR